MFKKITAFIKKQDVEAVILYGVIGASAGLAFYYNVQSKFRAEMFNQLANTVKTLGFEDAVIEHMQTHVYPKL